MRKLRFESLESRTLMAFGDLDTQFGDHGFVQVANTKTIDSSAYAERSLLLADGKRVLFGSSNTGSGPHPSMAKFMPDGTLDPSFGIGGKAVINQFRFLDVALVPTSGKFLGVVGEFGNNRLIRINANGSLDVSFGTDGVIEGVSPNMVQVSADGSFYTMSITTIGDANLRVIKFHEDGTKDVAFGNNGELIAFSGASSTYDKIEIDQQGRLYVSRTYYGDPTTNHFQIKRFSSVGIADDTFGQSGILDTITSKDSYTVTGWRLTTDAIFIAFQIGQDDKLAMHYKTDLNGQFDSGFGVGGKSEITFALKTRANQSRISVDIRDNGSVRYAGYGFEYQTSNEIVWSYVLTGQGSLVTNYGDGGFAKSFTQSFRPLGFVPSANNETELFGFNRKASGTTWMSSKKLDAQGVIKDWSLTPNNFQANFGSVASQVPSFILINNGVGSFVGQEGQHLLRFSAGMNSLGNPQLKVPEFNPLDYQTDSLGNVYALSNNYGNQLVKYKAQTLELDPTFGKNGFLKLDGFNLRLSIGPNAIMIWSDYNSNGLQGTQFQLFDLNGKVDLSFGTDGSITMDNVWNVFGQLATNGDFIYCAYDQLTNRTAINAIDSRGRGQTNFIPYSLPPYSFSSSNSQLIFDFRGRILAKIGLDVIRLMQNGLPDISFGANGVYSLNGTPALNESSKPVAIAAYDERVAIVIREWNATDKLTIVGIVDGHLDHDFGDAGVASIDIKGYSGFDRITWLPDASLLLSATTQNVMESFGTVVHLQGPTVNPRPKHNVFMPLNTDNDPGRTITPLDALVIVNELNSGPGIGNDPKDFTDVDADGITSPLDLLILINYLNKRSRGEGEASNLFLSMADAVAPAESYDRIWQQSSDVDEWLAGVRKKSRVLS